MQAWLQRCYASWEQFWFAPAFPLRLGLIRIGCGIIVVYTLIAYSYRLEEFLGEHAWLDLDMRLNWVRNLTVESRPWNGSLVSALTLLPPRNEQERRFLREYVQEFGVLPPAPYPRDEEENEYCLRFRRNFHWDLRAFGLPPPVDAEQRRYLEKYSVKFNQPPRPPYPHDAAEEAQIFKSIEKYKMDPHVVLARGLPVWSLWFHVTDPTQMRWVHAAALTTAVLFLAGFCTRVTAALTWFFFLNYIHRAPNILFGADTMLSIILFYLMIGPSGAALSVDRLLARKWGRDHQARPEPSVGANLALRLLQIHLCIIYLVAGLAKLLGPSWWNGTAVWTTLAYFELAPLSNPLYAGLLRLLAQSSTVFYTFLFLGTYFTLVFEIGYAFLIWRPRFRLWFLGAAFLLHGLIGVIMGLSTFAVIMAVMNLAFLKDRPPAPAPLAA